MEHLPSPFALLCNFKFEITLFIVKTHIIFALFLTKMTIS
ncbi:hypothetical protein HMPREF1545_02640 [Oscillibacter sp. KLE 1728]|nr:hypothetical protein HMPREF1545_02640 [Oscillibacter sp. KLE 1728]ERK59704.1 hypothetical protein HMPREF1546_03292 [Oscillibacter sp. KLE 1745]